MFARFLLGFKRFFFLLLAHFYVFPPLARFPSGCLFFFPNVMSTWVRQNCKSKGRTRPNKISHKCIYKNCRKKQIRSIDIVDFVTLVLCQLKKKCCFLAGMHQQHQQKLAAVKHRLFVPDIEKKHPVDIVLGALRRREGMLFSLSLHRFHYVLGSLLGQFSRTPRKTGHQIPLVFAANMAVCSDALIMTRTFLQLPFLCSLFWGGAPFLCFWPVIRAQQLPFCLSCMGPANISPSACPSPSRRRCAAQPPSVLFLFFSRLPSAAPVDEFRSILVYI